MPIGYEVQFWQDVSVIRKAVWRASRLYEYELLAKEARMDRISDAQREKLERLRKELWGERNG